MFKRIVSVCLLVLACAAMCLAQSAAPTGISPQSYGVVIGAGQNAQIRAANHAAMQACLQAAQASGQAVILPPTTIEIDVPNKGNSAASTLKVNKDLQVIGTDPQLSKLKFGPESPTYDYSGFYVGPNTQVLFKDCYIEGPTYAGPNGEYNHLTYAILQSGMSYAAGTPIYNTPGTLRLEGVHVAGEWYTSIQGSHGDTLLELINCDVTGYTQCVTLSASYNYGKRLHAQNTYFHDAGLPGKGHLIYLSPPVSFDIDNCRFGGNYRYAIHHYGSANLRAQYAILRNSVIESTCNDGIETTSTGTTQIINTVFNNRNRGIILKGDVSAQDCTFNCMSGVTTYDNYSTARISITHCRFNTTSVAVITSVCPNCVWSISDCDFTGVTAGGSAISSGAPGSQIIVDRSRFTGSWKRGIYATAGSYTISNCNFQGSYTDGAVIYDNSSGKVSQATVNNCAFQNTGRSIWACAGASGKVTGANNTFAGRQPEGIAGMYQMLQIGSQASPTTLASATQIAPNFNYNRYTVTGTTQIKNIKVGGTDVINKMAVGQVTLISSGWSLANTGNIRPRNTSPRPAGSVIVLQHDPQTDIWQEQ